MWRPTSCGTSNTSNISRTVIASALAAWVTSAGVLCGGAPAAIAHTIDPDTIGSGGVDSGPGYPLGGAKLAIQDGDKGKVVFRGRWRGARPAVDPTTSGALLRIAGAAGDGDTGAIQLPAASWKAKGQGFQYTDPGAERGGIRTVVLRFAKDGGKLKIKGGQKNWRYGIDGPQSEVQVTLEIGDARWCADFHTEHLKKDGAGAGPSYQLLAKAKDGPAACPCGGTVASTWDAIQTIFERHGCNEAICHGSTESGGLDLRPEAAYAELVGVPSTEQPAQLRVLPGDKDESLLWRKLAARTLGLEGAGRGMPLGDVAPLSEEELRVVALWIYNGAPETEVVPESERLLSSCLPSATPQKIPPPDPPAHDVGVQLRGAPWNVPASGEDEVCYATYYNFSAQIPPQFRGPCPPGRGQPGSECFYYKRIELIQDPNSHHSIPRVYLGEYDATDPSFGPYTCHGGPADGQPCSPKGLGVAAPAGAECGEGGACAGAVVPGVACLGYGPPDFAHGFNLADSLTAPYLLISTEPRYVSQFPEGVVEAMPVEGTMVWNSHAFNVTDQPTTNEQWLQLYFAAPEERRFLLQDFFDVEDIFVANVPPFEERRYCRTVTFKKGTRLFELTSHTHKRGRLFEMWGPGVWPPCRSFLGQPCEPEKGEPFLRTTDYADPHQVTFTEPVVLDGEDPATRTFKYCAVYDNGLSDPAVVKRRSTAPPDAKRCRPDELRCLAGPKRGAPCNADHAACDSSAGAGDGQCDACPVKGWVTADDEMFALLGSYFCAEGVDCALPEAVLAGF